MNEGEISDIIIRQENKVGHTIFTQKFFLHLTPQLINGSTMITLKSKHWNISNFQEWAQICPQIISTQCEFIKFLTYIYKLTIKPILSPPSIEAIQHIHFSHLIHLDVCRCNIFSVEALSFLDADSLKHLDMEGNYITCLKPLNKTKWKFFNGIIFEGNQISQIADISRTLTDQSVDKFRFHYGNRFIQIHNPGELMKFQSNHIKTMKLSYNQKVFNSNTIIDQLNQRFSPEVMTWGTYQKK